MRGSGHTRGRSRSVDETCRRGARCRELRGAMHESAGTTTGDHVAQNRAAWDRMAADYVEGGRRNWASDEVTWGIFDVPESRIGMLPPDLTGMDAVELGCGTGYVSAWLARRGARPVGIDNSPAQLETARR